MTTDNLLLKRVLQGTRTLKSAITNAQYKHPTGLFYGGTFETWSNRTLRTVFQRYLQDADRVAFVDIHTGLGPFGHGELICRFSPESADYKRMASWWGERVTPAQVSKAATASLRGTTTVAVPAMLPNAEVTSVTLEFGTFGPVKVLRALQAENWLHHHGGSNPAQASRIKARLKQVFYPETDDWKHQVWEQGQLIAGQAIKGLENGGLQAPNTDVAGDAS